MGIKGLSGSAGKNGTPAVLAPNVPLVHFNAALQIHAKLPTPLPNNDPVWKKLYRCETQPTAGEKGSPGMAGGKGGRGADGGNTSPTYLEIKNASGIKINPVQVPGAPGFGGNGGPGGKGGVGGLAGTMDPYGICTPAASGPEGVTGTTGEMGDVGKEGVKSPLCLKTGTATLGDCDFFQSLMGVNP
jgi:hypothetical protein